MNEPTSPPPGNQTQISLLLIGGVLLLAIALVLFFLVANQDQNDPDVNIVNGKPKMEEPAELTKEQLESLLEVKNLGIGLLENEQPGKSQHHFEKIIEQVPQEGLGHQNLAVAILMRLEQESARLSQSQLANLQHRLNDALVALKNLRGKSGTTYQLAAHQARHALQDSRIRSHLKQAHQLEPHNASILFQLFEATRQNAETSIQKQATEYLSQAIQVDPDNLFLLTEIILVEAMDQNPEILSHLQHIGELLEPLFTEIKQRTGFDVKQHLDQTVGRVDASADAATWKLIQRNVRILVNVLKPEDLLQSDRRRIVKNQLEYICFDFSERLQQRVQHVQDRHHKPLSVTFNKASKLPPQIANHIPTQVRFADMNLDSQPDMIVLTDQQLSVWQSPVQSQTSQEFLILPLEQVYSDFQLVDLDADIQVSPKQDADLQTDPRVQTGPQFDADLDLILYGPAGVTCYENRYAPDTDQRAWRAVTKNDALQNLKNVKTILPIDFDHDGDMDLCVATQSRITLWKHLDPYTFEQVTEIVSVPDVDLDIHSLIAVDWDRDVDLDIVVGTKQSQHLGYLENLRHGRYRWRKFLFQDMTAEAITVLDVIDLDANASWDILMASEQGIDAVMTHMTPAGELVFNPARRLIDTKATSIHLADFDNNGWLDLFARNPQAHVIWLSQPGNSFHTRIKIPEPIPTTVSYVTSTDLDADGDLDLCLLGLPHGDVKRGLYLLENKTQNENYWFEAGLRAEQIQGNQRSASGRVNHYGIGSLLELKAAGLYQPRIVTSQTTHFGLGQHKQADVLRILWTNGIPFNVIKPQANQRIYEKQILKGSCPYLYAWDGEQYRFVTDLLWAAPLGLVTPAGSIAPYREWEYLLMTGDQLKPRDGAYELQITEELWEAAYFDTVQLIAIDHPADFDIYSNEKVGPATIAAFGVHTAQSPRTPVSVKSQQQEDMLELVAKRDDRYAKPFQRKKRQGIVEPHYLEMDLGPLQKPQSIKLFLTGWCRPSDTSINTAIAQDTSFLPPAPLSLAVINREGEWETVMPFTGFPGGKTKTIVLDLTDRFLTDDYRIRLSSGQELYWDHVFFTVNETPGNTIQTKCELLTADLHFRGYSKAVPHLHYGPDHYDYARVSTAPQWPPMQGRFTRYGDVLELVRNKDERLAILGAGDELSLRFEVPDRSIPKGWKRDFFLYNVGWDKDADLNTVYGPASEPVPFYRMSCYPYVNESDFQYADILKQDILQRHTRRQNRALFWKQWPSKMPDHNEQTHKNVK